MVKRYSLFPTQRKGATDARQHKQGKWVKYEDHAAEVARLRGALSQRMCDRTVNAVLGLYQVRTGDPMTDTEDCGQCEPCKARAALEGTDEQD